MDEILGMINVFNALTIMVISGLIVWIVRQFLTLKIEGTKFCRVLVRVLPIILGGLLAMIPDIRPMEGSFVKSILIGTVAGSFSTSTYELLREIMGEKIKALMGSKAKRISDQKDEEV